MFDTSYFIQVIPKVFMKIPVTLEIAAISTVFALLIGVIVAVIAYFKIPFLYSLTRALVSFTRGTPLVAQLYFLYFGVAIYSTLVRDMTPTMAVCLVLSVNVGAFMSESIRGALMSVDEGQKEAALSLGMTNFQIISRIVLPQAVRVALPPLFNDFITLIKSSSLAFMLGVADIMGAARMEGSMSYRYFEVYAVVMIAYWILISGFGVIRNKLEIKCSEAF